MNRIKIIYSILKEVQNGTFPNQEDYGITKDQFGDVVDMIIDEELIVNATVVRGGQGNKVQTVFLQHAKISIKGLSYLEENSTLAKTYKGLKEIKEWFSL